MLFGRLAGVGMANSVITPSGVIRPMLLPRISVNQRFPSGPAVISHGAERGVGTGNSVSTASGVMRPIRFPGISVNHTFPSGPAVITSGCPPAVTGYSVTAPVDGVSRPIAPAPAVVRRSVNHTLPSDPTATAVGLLAAVGTGYSVIAPSPPTVIPSGALPAVGIGYSVTEPADVMRPIAPAVNSVNHMAPSPAATISLGPACAVGNAYSVKLPACPLLADAADENPVTTRRMTATHRPMSDPTRPARGCRSMGFTVYLPLRSLRLGRPSRRRPSSAARPRRLPSACAITFWCCLASLTAVLGFMNITLLRPGRRSCRYQIRAWSSPCTLFSAPAGSR